jgi:hypothetical protein
MVTGFYHRNASPVPPPGFSDEAHSPVPSEGMNAKLIESLEQSKNIQDEDISISESVQCGIGSLSYEKGRYAPGVEITEYHFHRLIHGALEEELEMKVKATEGQQTTPRH